MGKRTFFCKKGSSGVFYPLRVFRSHARPFMKGLYNTPQGMCGYIRDCFIFGTPCTKKNKYMCGITGTISLDNFKPVPEETLDKMTRLLEHRGPDGQGLYQDENIALGHRRLSIIDLSEAGTQPMQDVSGRFVVSFNGEIYNFKEIKTKLQAKGYLFCSDTDTEVLLNAFAEYRESCWEHFIGMFAFAIHDKQSKESFIFRDRLGIKPLFYAVHDGKLVFASEPKSILAYPGFPTDYSPQGVSSYLSYRYAIGENSMYARIKTLRPGHFIRIKDGKFEVKQYYELPLFTEKEDLGEAAYIEKIRECLQSSVAYRMIADVPFGAYLSGGLDSSIVSALMAQQSRHPVKTFTIGFQEEGYNEFSYARQVAERYATEHRAFDMPAEEYFGLLQKLIYYKDAPLGVANEPALYQMSAELKKHITVVLSGEGADEVFGGYGRIFRSAYDYERMQGLSAFAEGEAASLLGKNLQKKYGQQTFSSPLEHFLGQYRYIKKHEKQAWLSDGFWESIEGDSANTALFQAEFDKTEGLELSERYMWLFEKLHLPGLLQRVDMTTMATSVEARVPFVDHRLVELAMSIPLKYKLKWRSLVAQALAGVQNADQISEKLDHPKYILKKAFEKDLPQDVVWRKKMGFPVPLHKWLGGGFRESAQEVLLSDKARQRGLYNTQAIEKLLQKRELLENHGLGLKVWMLVNLELWLSR